MKWLINEVHLYLCSFCLLFGWPSQYQAWVECPRLSPGGGVHVRHGAWRREGGGELDCDTAMIKYAAWGFNLSRGEIVRLRSIIDTNNDDTLLLTAAQRAAITDQDILQLPGAASPLSSSWSGLSLVDILHISVTIRILISYLSYMRANQIRMHTMDKQSHGELLISRYSAMSRQNMTQGGGRGPCLFVGRRKLWFTLQLQH